MLLQICMLKDQIASWKVNVIRELRETLAKYVPFCGQHTHKHKPS